MGGGQVFAWAVENGFSAPNPATLIRPEKAFGHARSRILPRCP
jgi:hypothetical protein